jgi:Peptide methionine sulfoxide reductase
VILGSACFDVGRPKSISSFDRLTIYTNQQLFQNNLHYTTTNEFYRNDFQDSCTRRWVRNSGLGVLVVIVHRTANWLVTYSLQSPVHGIISQRLLQFPYSQFTHLLSVNIHLYVTTLHDPHTNSCYWGTEKYVVMDFQKRFPDSIESTSVGFMSPDPNAIQNPSYRQVCSGTTSHVEVLQVALKNPDAHFEELIKFFFMFHGEL